MNKYRYVLLLITSGLLISCKGEPPKENNDKYFLPGTISFNNGSSLKSFTYDDDLLGYSEIITSYEGETLIKYDKYVCRYSADYKTLTEYDYAYDIVNNNPTLTYVEKAVEVTTDNTVSRYYYYMYPNQSSEFSLDTEVVYTYDDADRLLEMKKIDHFYGDPYTYYKYLYTYDNEGRLIKEQYLYKDDDDHSQLNLDYEAVITYTENNKKEVETEYDDEGTILDVNTTITEYSVDGENKLEHILIYDIDGQPNLLRNEHFYVYDKNDEFVSHTAILRNDEGQFSSGSKSVREFDSLGNVNKYTVYDALSENEFVVEFQGVYTYDENNNQITCAFEDHLESPYYKTNGYISYNEVNQITNAHLDIYDYSSEQYATVGTYQITFLDKKNDKLFELMDYEEDIVDYVDSNFNPTKPY